MCRGGLQWWCAAHATDQLPARVVFLVVRARLEARCGEGVGLITMRHPWPIMAWHGRAWDYEGKIWEQSRETHGPHAMRPRYLCLLNTACWMASTEQPAGATPRFRAAVRKEFDIPASATPA